MAGTGHGQPSGKLGGHWDTLQEDSPPTDNSSEGTWGPWYPPRAGVPPTSPCLSLGWVTVRCPLPASCHPSPAQEARSLQPDLCHGTGGSGHRPARCPLSSAPADVAYLRSVLPSTTEDAFFDYLATLDTSEVTVSAVPEGSVIFARVRHARYPPLLQRGFGAVGICVPSEDRDVTAWLSRQVPFLQVKGPLLVVQLLETMLLCLVNYAR